MVYGVGRPYGKWFLFNILQWCIQRHMGIIPESSQNQLLSDWSMTILKYWFYLLIKLLISLAGICLIQPDACYIIIHETGNTWKTMFHYSTYFYYCYCQIFFTMLEEIIPWFSQKKIAPWTSSGLVLHWARQGWEGMHRLWVVVFYCWMLWLLGTYYCIQVVSHHLSKGCLFFIMFVACYCSSSSIDAGSRLDTVILRKSFNRCVLQPNLRPWCPTRPLTRYKQGDKW